MALPLTMFLHRGTSEVSVSFLCSSACSSALSLAAFCCSRPQKLSTAFLHKPGFSWGSVMEEKNAIKKICLCAYMCEYICICLYNISADYLLFPYCRNLCYQPNPPVQDPPSPPYSSSGSSTIDTTRQTAHRLKRIIYKVGYGCVIFRNISQQSRTCLSSMGLVMRETPRMMIQETANRMMEK